MTYVPAVIENEGTHIPAMMRQMEVDPEAPSLARLGMKAKPHLLPNPKVSRREARWRLRVLRCLVLLEQGLLAQAAGRVRPLPAMLLEIDLVVHEEYALLAQKLTLLLGAGAFADLSL